MSILIKGMEMPNCNDCPLAGDFKCNLMPSIPALCKEYDIAVQNGTRLDNCPLVEIPPHGRLIDADTLTVRHGWLDNFDNTHTHIQFVYANEINYTPTIIGSEGKDE